MPKKSTERSEMLPKHYKLTKEERETHYCITEIDGVCIVYTSIKRDIKMFKKKGWELIKETLYPNGELESCVFKAPRKFLFPPRAYFGGNIKTKRGNLKSFKKNKLLDV